MNGNGRNWLDIVGDAFLLFVLFALWLWQFESSEKSPLYHDACGNWAGVSDWRLRSGCGNTDKRSLVTVAQLRSEPSPR